MIDAGVLAGLEQAASLDLQSYGAITFQGDVNIAMADSAATLTLGGGSLTGTGGQVTISAPTLVLDNTLGAPTAPTGGTGSLSLEASELIFADGAKSVSGFGAISLTAQQAAIGPVASEIFNKARKGWTDGGGELISLPADEQAQMMKTFSSVGADVSKSKRTLDEAYKIVTDAAARTQ